MTKAVFGLGNPGWGYTFTRHNIGFEVVDQYRAARGSRVKGRIMDSALCYRLDDLLLVKPMTFMNASGEAVRSVLGRHRISPDDALIVYDDLDLSLGRIRILSSGGAGSHKGMQSVIQAVGTERIPRLRMGIEVMDRDLPGQEFVLERFLWSEWEQLQPSIRRAVEAIETFRVHGIDQAMTRFNRQE